MAAQCARARRPRRRPGSGGQGAGRVARVDAGLLDVLHHPADDHVTGGVAHRVHVDLDGVLQEPVDQHRPLGRHPALPAERADPAMSLDRRGQPLVVVDDLHGPAAEDVARPHQHGVADAPRPRRWLRRRSSPCHPGLGDAEPATARSSARGPRPGRWRRRRPEHQLGREGAGQLQGGLSPRQTITPTTRPANRGVRSAPSTFSRSSGVSGSKYSRSDVS